MPVSYSLKEYSGSWTRKEVGHLLRRTMFGPTNRQILNAVENGLESAIVSLMNIPSIGKPLAFHEDESIVAEGKTWVNAVYPEGDVEKADVNNSRVKSLYAWLMESLNDEQKSISICQKMTLFWQNHFGVTLAADARGEYDYITLLRNNALGNFKQLVKDVTVHPEMLVFLNGNSNTKWKPNENFGRELLELFTIGKGPQIGPGDYTNYTEEDISICAKILTGFKVRGYRSSTETSYYSEFEENHHNTEVKTLTSKFGSAEIQPNGENEYADLIDVIFLQEEVSKHICRKLYRYFVGSEISIEVEDSIIVGLAATLRDNDYEIQPVLEQLLKSEHFYDESHIGCMIKSPLEMIFSMLNGTETKANYDVVARYETYLAVYWNAGGLDQSYLAPPSVAGWPAYYQEPSFSRLWLNASLIKGRFDVIDWWVRRNGIQKNGQKFNVQGLDFVNNLQNPEDPVAVVDNMIAVFLPKGTTDSQKLEIKNILTNGLPDFEWTDQYNEYRNSPDDPTYSDPVIKRIKETLNTVFFLPEFQTM